MPKWKPGEIDDRWQDLKMGLNFWQIDTMLCRAGDAGHSFSIWVSPEYLRFVRGMTVSEEKRALLLKGARRINRAEWPDLCVGKMERFVRFDEFGLVSWDCALGSATGMFLDRQSPLWDVHDFRFGATFQPHNVDTAQQMAVLLKIWLEWVGYVEFEYVDDLRGKED